MDNTESTTCEVMACTSIISAANEELRASCSAPATVSPCTSDASTSETLPSSHPSITGRQFANVEVKYLVDPYVIGSGRQGSVRQCMDRKTGKRFAIKSIQKSDPSVKPRGLQREIMLLNEMRHINSIHLADVFEDKNYVHLITDLCEGGELFDRTVEQASSSNGCFSEYEAARILHQILSAVSYMHRRNIVHRDIKPENILFENDGCNSSIKIIDFGLARKHNAKKGEAPMTAVVGTPYYIAPEVLRRNYDKACDLWSIGVIAYILLCGYPPFNGTTAKAVCRAVVRDPVRFQTKVWKNSSTGAKDFIVRLLQKEPRTRMTVEQALRHPWIVSQLKISTQIKE